MCTLTACHGGKEEGRLAEHIADFDIIRTRILAYDTMNVSRIVASLRSKPTSRLLIADDYRAIDLDYIDAWTAYIRRDKSESKAYAKKALDGLYVINDTASKPWNSLTSDMEYILGVIDFENDSLPSAFAHLGRSLKLSRAASYSLRLSQLHSILAVANRNTNDYNGCLAHVRTAEIILDTVETEYINPTSRMSALAQCASVAIDLGAETSCDRLLCKASSIYDQASVHAKMQYLHQLVRFRFMFKQYSQATISLNKLRMLVNKSRHKEAASDVAVYQGLSRCRLGELEFAELYRKEVKPHHLSNEGRILINLLDGEIATLKKQYAKAETLLFDSVKIDLTSSPFLVSLVNESRITLYMAQERYSNAFQIMGDNRRRLSAYQNDFFSANDRARDELVAKAMVESNARKHIGKATHNTRFSTLDVVLHATLWAIVITFLILFFRWRGRRIAADTAVHNEVLKEELNKKIEELEHQSKMLETTNGRIADSITYAEHIQHSIAPDPGELNSYPISGSFVFYSPLDIVSGDFFWFTKKNDYLIVCCADCTGHGVPGAFMSMIAMTIINDLCERIVDNDVDPAAILESLDYSLISNMAHNRNEQGDAKDGLDIAITCLNLVDHRVHLASARRPSVVVKDDEVIVVKGTKRSIGDVEPSIHARKFESTTLQLSPGDAIYMYSDGYSDQFGGRNGSKMKNSRIENFLSAIHNEDMDEQGLTIQEFFIQWKGDYPQTDDVLFVGLKV